MAITQAAVGTISSPKRYSTVSAGFVTVTGSGGTTSTVTDYNGSGETWKVHQFTSNGTFAVTQAGATERNPGQASPSISARALVVAGGGRGATNYWSGAVSGYGAGGGAGGMLEEASLSLSGSNSVVVGSAGSPGGSSSIATVSCTGGGRGGYSFATRSQSGGSGGGGDGDSYQGYNRDGAAGILGQGTYGQNGSAYAGGNGGGAGTGASTSHNRSGRASNITGASVTYSIGGLKNSASTPSGYGHGGGGSTSNSNNSKAGRNGIVVVAYKVS